MEERTVVSDECEYPSIGIPELDDDSNSAVAVLEEKYLTLTDLPLEIIERVVLSLDAHSAFHLQQSCSYTKSAVRRVLRGNNPKCLQFWEKACKTEIPKQLLANMMGSYFNLIEENLRMEIQRGGILYNSRRFTYKHVYKNAFELLGKLKYSKITQVPMTGLEIQIKTGLWLTCASRRDQPERFTSTKGTLLYNVITPGVPRSTEPEPKVLQVLENMSTCRRETVSPVKNEKLDYFIIMTLPVQRSISESSKIKSLPKVYSIFVGVGPKAIYLASLHGGQPLLIPVPENNHMLKYFCDQMPCPVSALDDYLGVWTVPDQYTLYRVRVNPISDDVETEIIVRIQDIESGGDLSCIWNRIAQHYKDVMPNLSYYVGSPYPFLELISPHVRIGSYAFMTEPSFKVIRHEPKTPFQQFSGTYSCGIDWAKGHGTYLFWNRHSLVIGYDLNFWQYHKWMDIGVEETVSLIEVIAPCLLMLNALHEIIFLKISFEGDEKSHSQFQRGSLNWNRPLIFEKLRCIETKSITLDHYVKSFHFDFERGHPYIFLNLSHIYVRHLKEYENVILKKIVFYEKTEIDSDDELDSPALYEEELEAEIHKEKQVYTSQLWDPRKANSKLTSLLMAFGAQKEFVL